MPKKSHGQESTDGGYPLVDKNPVKYTYEEPPMRNARKTSNAVRILHRRYVGEDVRRKASLEQERMNAEVARTIFELRQQAGLSQKELAERVETTQSVISRLEDADYEGHSLSMLNRIAKALNRKVQVVMRPKERNPETIMREGANVAVLEPDVAKVFRNSAAVNEALRSVLRISETTRRLTRPPSGRAANFHR
jgi:transcriptional regulator with XRE-family HTH domain